MFPGTGYENDVESVLTVRYLSLVVWSENVKHVWDSGLEDVFAKVSKICEKDIKDGCRHEQNRKTELLFFKWLHMVQEHYNSVTGHETKFAYPTKMTSLTIKIKEKL